MERPSILLRRARQVYDVEGMTSLLRRVAAFLAYCVFEYRDYWLCAEPTERSQELTEAEFLPNIDNLTLKIVTSDREADDLEVDGLAFHSDVPNLRERLDNGAVAFCLFVGSELANIGWVAMTQRAKDGIGEPPYFVDFSRNEACWGAAWTNPKHRGRKLLAYSMYKRLEFMRDGGIATARDAVAKDNVAAQNGRAGVVASSPCAEGRYLRVLWWKRWTERPLASQYQEAIG